MAIKLNTEINIKKELIWNIALLIFGILILFPLRLNNGSWNLNAAIGWTQDIVTPLGLINKVKLQFGLYFGVGLIVLRYILIALIFCSNFKK